MFENIKTNINEKLHQTGLNAGLIAMSAAVSAGLIEVSGHHDKKLAVVPQPVYAVTGEYGNSFEKIDHSSERRHLEETHPHGSSYGVSQRTPGRAGTL